ncbi:PC4-domain-containing protein [Amniculicola lignicola CBS 123094]|uniref:PC4-domain-containing protein n=1 Tax=Amniculicola lignicola CBS 123094 TaxID=1392246 RepID=A0A6A5WHH6_9PLEO|nr:PC4-domain-containing protein [Amniculicola lignicola CBS 123094]
MSGRGGFKKAGYAKRGGGGFKGSYTRKRSSVDDEEAAPRKTKRSKAEEEEEEGAVLVPTLKEDDDGNSYVSLKANGMRRVMISDFKGTTFVNIREYWKNDEDKVLPGKKGISLTVEQYNALLAAAPLLESVLAKKGETTTRPEYGGKTLAATDDGDEDEEAVAKAEDEEDKDEEDDE